MGFKSKLQSLLAFGLISSFAVPVLTSCGKEDSNIIKEEKVTSDSIVFDTDKVLSKEIMDNKPAVLEDNYAYPVEGVTYPNNKDTAVLWIEGGPENEADPVFNMGTPETAHGIPYTFKSMAPIAHIFSLKQINHEPWYAKKAATLSELSSVLLGKMAFWDLWKEMVDQLKTCTTAPCTKYHIEKPEEFKKTHKDIIMSVFNSELFGDSARAKDNSYNEIYNELIDGVAKTTTHSFTYYDIKADKADYITFNNGKITQSPILKGLSDNNLYKLTSTKDILEIGNKLNYTNAARAVKSIKWLKKQGYKHINVLGGSYGANIINFLIGEFPEILADVDTATSANGIQKEIVKQEEAQGFLKTSNNIAPNFKGYGPDFTQTPLSPVPSWKPGIDYQALDDKQWKFIFDEHFDGKTDFATHFQDFTSEKLKPIGKTIVENFSATAATGMQYSLLSRVKHFSNALKKLVKEKCYAFWTNKDTNVAFVSPEGFREYIKYFKGAYLLQGSHTEFVSNPYVMYLPYKGTPLGNSIKANWPANDKPWNEKAENLLRDVSMYNSINGDDKKEIYQNIYFASRYHALITPDFDAKGQNFEYFRILKEWYDIPEYNQMITKMGEEWTPTKLQAESLKDFYIDSNNLNDKILQKDIQYAKDIQALIEKLKTLSPDFAAMQAKVAKVFEAIKKAPIATMVPPILELESKVADASAWATNISHGVDELKNLSITPEQINKGGSSPEFIKAVYPVVMQALGWTEKYATEYSIPKNLVVINLLPTILGYAMGDEHSKEQLASFLFASGINLSL